VSKNSKQKTVYMTLCFVSARAADITRAHRETYILSHHTLIMLLHYLGKSKVLICFLKNTKDTY